MKSVIQKLKSILSGKQTIKVLYAPEKTGEPNLEGLNLYTVEITEPLFTKGRKSGFIGKVAERENHLRAFRFDRIESLVEA